jgi:hypothetical protein
MMESSVDARTGGTGTISTKARSKQQRRKKMIAIRDPMIGGRAFSLQKPTSGVRFCEENE